MAAMVDTISSAAPAVKLAVAEKHIVVCVLWSRHAQQCAGGSTALQCETGRLFNSFLISRTSPALFQIARLQRVVLTPAVAAQFLATSVNDGSDVINPISISIS